MRDLLWLPREPDPPLLVSDRNHKRLYRGLD
jgi:hypothetical protein